MKEFSIIYEDDEILLVNKECGVAVQGGEGVEHSLDKGLSVQVGYKVHLVHRLDKETSGILIVAKNPAAATKWTNLIQGDSVKKTYTAFCVGVPRVRGEVQKSATLSSVIDVHGKKQKALLRYTVVQYTENQFEDDCYTFSKLKIVLGTGRMHQIRIQLSSQGCPIMGDDRHGDFAANRALKKKGVKKLHLAATELVIPVGGELRKFEIPLPDHMKVTDERFFSGKEDHDGRQQAC